MTIKQILATYPKQLKKTSPARRGEKAVGGIEEGVEASPALDVELLLSKVIKKPKEFLFAHSEQKLSPIHLLHFLYLYHKRKNGIPIAYLLGHQEFYGLDFTVNKHVLIPRPETELLVQETLNFLPLLDKRGAEGITIIDLGTGSGAVIISLVKSLQSSPAPKGDSFGTKEGDLLGRMTRGEGVEGQFSTFNFLSTDISHEALKVAKKNAQKHKVSNKITFLFGSLLEPLKSQRSKVKGQMLIMANLPYLSDQAMKEESIQCEPKSALYGGPDGLAVYRSLFSQLITYNLQPAAIFLEIGDQQGPAIIKIVKGALPEYTIDIKQDLCGFNRLAVIKK